MNDIEQWLASPGDYEAGRLLFERYGSFPRLKATLQRGGDCDLNRQYLVYELDKIKHLGTTASAQQSGAAAASTGPREQKIILCGQNDSGKKMSGQNLPKMPVDDYAQLPDPIRALVDEWKSLYKFSVHFHSQLTVVTTEEERGQLAIAIEENFDRIHEVWDQLEYYKQHQQLPTPPEPVHTAMDRGDPVLVLKRINNLKSYISRAAKRGDAEEKVLAWQQEKSELEALLVKP